MKNNGPVTHRELKLGQGGILVSKTDLKGRITYCNQDFIEISGFSEAELMGSSHNIVRHPDMPAEAFADLWNHMKAGKPWSGIVKNRSKSGDHYWVNANISPICRNGKVAEYMSVRTAPSRAEIEQAEALYKDVRNGQKKLPGGSGFFARILNKVSTSLLLYGAVGVAAALNALVAAMIMTKAPDVLILTTLGIGASLSLLAGIIITQRSVRPLKYAVDKLQQITQGDYFDWVSTKREDEFGQLLMALRAMQTQLGFEVMDARDQATRAGRIKAALDNASANVMIADAGNTIIYGNPSLLSTFKRRQGALQSLVPNFDISRLTGEKMDRFHHHPAQQQRLLANLKHSHHDAISINDCHLNFIATPIFDEHHHRIGTVMEWVDRTEQVAVENEVQKVVEGARAGVLHQRLQTAGREGFFKTLSASINELLHVNETVIGESILALDALAHGNLTRLVTGDYQGEFEHLKHNINTSILQLTDMIEQITHTAEAVENGVAEIAAGNEDLSRRTENQVNALERSASAMEEINGTIQQSASHAAEASRLAESAKSKADSGGRVIGSAISAMENIREANHRISSISDLIDGIAFQTNLLALNAAVEAAHAANHGQGFGVVAKEVRDLAQKTSIAAKEVQELVRDSLDKVTRGTQLVGQSGDILKEIITQSTTVSGMVQEISLATQEQAEGVREISQNFVQLDRTTQENAALVQETTSANQSLMAETRQLGKLVERFQLAGQATRRHTAAAHKHSSGRYLESA